MLGGANSKALAGGPSATLQACGVQAGLDSRTQADSITAQAVQTKPAPFVLCAHPFCAPLRGGAAGPLTLSRWAGSGTRAAARAKCRSCRRTAAPGPPCKHQRGSVRTVALPCASRLLWPGLQDSRVALPSTYLTPKLCSGSFPPASALPATALSSVAASCCCGVCVAQSRRRRPSLPTSRCCVPEARAPAHRRQAAGGSLAAWQGRGRAGKGPGRARVPCVAMCSCVMAGSAASKRAKWPGRKVYLQDLYTTSVAGTLEARSTRFIWERVSPHRAL